MPPKKVKEEIPPAKKKSPVKKKPPHNIIHPARARPSRRLQLSMNKRSIINRKSTLWRMNHPFSIGKSVTL